MALHLFVMSVIKNIKNNMKVTVIGATGWVGKAMVQLFPHAYNFSTTLEKEGAASQTGSNR